MSTLAYKTAPQNRTKTMRFCSIVSTGKERDEETGYGYFGARYMDHELMTMWLSVDPMADKYPSINPYAYCAWNPVKLVDPNGMDVSTHTDANGNVVAVYDDGDNGVYRHNGDREYTMLELQKNYSISNTSANGQWMGESLHSLSFADQNYYNKTRKVKAQQGMSINYGSVELTTMAEMIMKQKPSLFQYQSNAGSGGVWDIKAHISTGSKLYGKYASPRDAGNFVAGMVAASKGFIGEIVAQVGYGAYNLSGNNKRQAAVIVFNALSISMINVFMGIKEFEYIMNGEDFLSQRCIDLGKAYQHKKNL